MINSGDSNIKVLDKIKEIIWLIILYIVFFVYWVVFLLILSFILNSVIRITLKEIIFVSFVFSTAMIVLRIVKLIIKK